ncbi:MAG TPA: hypothetical protein VGJ32_10860 [Solirubrobacteraceae bacterium]|jgi:hypothetical protein
MTRRLLTALLALAVVAVAAPRLHGTSAAFTDSHTTSIAISTGSVAIEHDGDGLTFTSAPLAPGDKAEATVRVTSSGSLAARLALTREQLTSTAPAGCAIRDALRLRVDEEAGGEHRTVADGPLGEVADALELGRFASGETRTYALTITFAPQHGATATDNDNCLQGSVDTERFAWQAVEARS